MITMDQVENLKAYANVSYEEAKEALEATNGDLLEAVIYLEKQGKTEAPSNGGAYRTEAGNNGANYEQEAKNIPPYREENTLGQQMRKLWNAFCKLVHKGNINHFEANKNGNCATSIPVNVLVLGLLFLFWITLPLIIVGLFCGYTYKFVGPDLGKESVNNAMDLVAETAESIKKSVAKDEKKDI